MAARIAAANQDAAAAGKPAALAMAPAAVRRAAAQQAYVTPAAAASAAATAAATAAPQRLTSVDAPGLSIVVLDSGAFLSSGSALLHGTSAGFELLARLYREGNSEVRFVTIAAVIAELKDEKTRAMMAALPFQIEVLDVHPDAVREGRCHNDGHTHAKRVHSSAHCNTCLTLCSSVSLCLFLCSAPLSDSLCAADG